MKKTFLSIGFCLAVFGCATSPAGFDRAEMDAALDRMSAKSIAELPKGSTVTVMNFVYPDKKVSQYIVQTSEGKLKEQPGLVLVTRNEAELALITGEQEFNLSKEVSDESALSYGKMLGAQYIITGRMDYLEGIGGGYRFMMRALNVETGEIAVISESDLSDRGKGKPASTAKVAKAPKPKPALTTSKGDTTTAKPANKPAPPNTPAVASQPASAPVSKPAPAPTVAPKPAPTPATAVKPAPVPVSVVPDGLKWEVVGSTVRITRYTGKAATLKIPDRIEWLPVTYIGYSAFEDYENLTSVSIPPSAFEGCESLTSVSIPSSVTYIGDRAFEGCTSLTSVSIPSSVTAIEGWAFEDCESLTSVSIPSSVTAIGNSAFRRCTSLTSVSIPSSVTAIGNSAFKDCDRLKSITLSRKTTVGYGALPNGARITYID